MKNSVVVAALVAVFASGVALALTPCVLPQQYTASVFQWSPNGIPAIPAPPMHQTFAITVDAPTRRVKLDVNTTLDQYGISFNNILVFQFYDEKLQYTVEDNGAGNCTVATYNEPWFPPVIPDNSTYVGNFRLFKQSDNAYMNTWCANNYASFREACFSVTADTCWPIEMSFQTVEADDSVTYIEQKLFNYTPFVPTASTFALPPQCPPFPTLTTTVPTPTV